VKNILIILILAACATNGGDRKNEKRNPSDDIQAAYSQAVDRLKNDFSENGWIVSRHQDGNTEHEGDSLIWTGLAMASLPCADGEMFSRRMARMIDENDGAMVRYEPLGEYAGGREISFDGATGLYFGIFQRIRQCPDEAQIWKATWQNHLTYLEENNWKLHPNADALVAPPFNVIRDYISYQLGLTDDIPSGVRLRSLEAAALTWSSAVIESKSSCFRVHLAFLYMLFLDDADLMLETAYDGFCYATEEADIPAIDHWCDRKNIDDWIKTFEYDLYEYRHQRCGGWEKPDGKSLKTPGLDLIFGIQLAYPEVLNGN
jgi:hypothetical protein